MTKSNNKNINKEKERIKESNDSDLINDINQMV
jgi:hypothetical protein